jgi:carbon-monoxide dehydrogenase small subunit
MRSILAVDDSPSMRKMVSFTLTGAGFKVVEAVDGVDALEKAQAENIDLVLADQNMPRLDGIGLTRKLREDLESLAPRALPVLIRGETGSGKERVARCLHDFGPRAGKPFVALNCAAIPEHLFEAELFGHESGAFTGAQGKRIGRLEYADGGTVFLDEKPVLSCSVLAARVNGRSVTTLEGLQEEAAEFGAFIADQGAEQCGFCNPGFIMNVLAMERELKDPTEEEIKEYLAGNLCRCSGYMSQLRAVKKYLDAKQKGGRD